MIGRYVGSLIAWLFVPLVFMACAQIPTGADPVEFRLRESQLNVQTIKSTIPLAGYSEEDQAKLSEIFTKVDQVLTAAQTAYKGGGDPLDTIESAIPVLNKIVAQIDSEKGRQDGQRLVATLNLTVQVLKNQRTLEQEFNQPAI